MEKDAEKIYDIANERIGRDEYIKRLSKEFGIVIDYKLERELIAYRSNFKNLESITKKIISLQKNLKSKELWIPFSDCEKLPQFKNIAFVFVYKNLTLRNILYREKKTMFYDNKMIYQNKLSTQDFEAKKNDCEIFYNPNHLKFEDIEVDNCYIFSTTHSVHSAKLISKTQNVCNFLTIPDNAKLELKDLEKIEFFCVNQYS